MMKRLRGRNLAHPGCLIGVTVGLSLGIILAGVLASIFGVAYNTILLIWLAMTIGLGVVGWIIGSILTSRFPALPQVEGEHGEPIVLTTEEHVESTITNKSGVAE